MRNGGNIFHKHVTCNCSCSYGRWKRRKTKIKKRKVGDPEVLLLFVRFVLYLLKLTEGGAMEMVADGTIRTDAMACLMETFVLQTRPAMIAFVLGKIPFSEANFKTDLRERERTKRY